MDRYSSRANRIAHTFHPRSVAVVGASPTGLVGRQVGLNLDRLGFRGLVGLVNPRHSEVLGRVCYPSLSDLPFVPDVVVAAVSADRVESVLEDAAAVGAGSVVVFASGFGDAGAAGQERERRLRESAERSGLAVIGPNGQGCINFWDAAPLYMEAVSPYVPGHAALLSQSGSIATALVNSRKGVRWGYVVSSGNEAVVTADELLEFFVANPRVTVICCYIETLRDAPRFFEQCDKAQELGKTIVVLKSGRSEASRRASVAHSGRLTGSDRLVDALFERHGVIRVESMEELLGTAAVMLARPPKGGRVATLTTSGGHAALLLDACEGGRLVHAGFSEQTVRRLRELLPPSLPINNPLDYWSAPDALASCPDLMRAVSEDPGVDVVLTFVTDLSAYPTVYPGKINQPIPVQIESAGAIAATTEKSLVVAVPLGEDLPPGLVEYASRANVALVSGLANAVKGLSNALRPLPAGALPADARAESPGSPSPPSPRQGSHRPSRRQVGQGAQAALSSLAGRTWSGTNALSLVEQIGIPVVKCRLAEDEHQAAAAARDIGFPVVLKSGREDLAHKSERGGVITGLYDGDNVAREARALLEKDLGPLLVQPQLAPDAEMILGLVTEPPLGTFVVFGLGGVWTEVLDDVKILPVGSGRQEIFRGLGTLRASRLLDDGSDKSQARMEAIYFAISQLDAFGRGLGHHVASVDINPLIVTGTAVVAVDAVVVPAGTDASEVRQVARLARGV